MFKQRLNKEIIVTERVARVREKVLLFHKFWVNEEFSEKLLTPLFLHRFHRLVHSEGTA
jgi:hypothetical protein